MAPTRKSVIPLACLNNLRSRSTTRHVGQKPTGIVKRKHIYPTSPKLGGVGPVLKRGANFDWAGYKHHCPEKPDHDVDPRCITKRHFIWCEHESHVPGVNDRLVWKATYNGGPEGGCVECLVRIRREEAAAARKAAQDAADRKQQEENARLATHLEKENEIKDEAAQTQLERIKRREERQRKEDEAESQRQQDINRFHESAMQAVLATRQTANTQRNNPNSVQQPSPGVLTDPNAGRKPRQAQQPRTPSTPGQTPRQPQTPSTSGRGPRQPQQPRTPITPVSTEQSSDDYQKMIRLVESKDRQMFDEAYEFLQIDKFRYGLMTKAVAIAEPIYREKIQYVQSVGTMNPLEKEQYLKKSRDAFFESKKQQKVLADLISDEETVISVTQVVNGVRLEPRPRAFSNIPDTLTCPQLSKSQLDIYSREVYTDFYRTIATNGKISLSGYQKYIWENISFADDELDRITDGLLRIQEEHDDSWAEFHSGNSTQEEADKFNEQISRLMERTEDLEKDMLEYQTFVTRCFELLKEPPLE